MSATLIVAMLIAWIVVGAGIAFMFGSVSRRSDLSDDIEEMAPPVVKHLRPRKRAVSTQAAPSRNLPATRRTASGA